MMSAMRDYVEPTRKIREIQGTTNWKKHAKHAIILVTLVLLCGVFGVFRI